MKRISILMMALLFVSALGAESAFADAADVGKTLTSKTFTFKHKQADKAANVIKGILSAEGSMSIQPAANSLVVTDLPANMKKIAAAIATFDAPAQALQLSIRLVSASRGEQNKVDADLADVASKLALLRYNMLESIGTAQARARKGSRAWSRSRATALISALASTIPPRTRCRSSTSSCFVPRAISSPRCSRPRSISNSARR